MGLRSSCPGVLRCPAGDFVMTGRAVGAVVSLSWEATSVAVALLTAENAGTGDRAGEILGDADREEVIGALVLLGGAFLRELRPAPGAPAIGCEGATEVLQAIGLRVLEEASR
jgi:hypothetical protein